MFGWKCTRNTSRFWVLEPSESGLFPEMSQTCLTTCSFLFNNKLQSLTLPFLSTRPFRSPWITLKPLSSCSSSVLRRLVLFIIYQCGVKALQKDSPPSSRAVFIITPPLLLQEPLTFISFTTYRWLFYVFEQHTEKSRAEGRETCLITAITLADTNYRRL